MFSELIQTKYVRSGIFAHQYSNGVININGEKYLAYSMSDAISLFRKKYPKYSKK
jgi:hypothetical protein